MSAPFWEAKPLAEMTDAEWESICDGCGRCCLLKLEEDDGAVLHTAVACRWLDLDACRCRCYPERHARVPDCIEINAANVAALRFLPASCGYRRLAEGRGLAWWHPLVSGDPATVAEAGIAVAGKVVSEAGVHPDDLERHVIRWVEA